MSEAVKFFSQEWCAAAGQAANANDDVIRGFKDAAAFRHLIAFRVLGRADLVTDAELKSGKVVSWTASPTVDDSHVCAIVDGDPPSWQACAAGQLDAAKSLVAGKLKLVKAPMDAAIRERKSTQQLRQFLEPGAHRLERMTPPDAGRRSRGSARSIVDEISSNNSFRFRSVVI